MTPFLALQELLLAAEESTEPEAASGPEVFGIGSVVLIVVVIVVLAWMAFLVLNSRRSRTAAPEETPQNLQPYLSDDELESRRTTRVLRAALIGAALLAVVLPWYAFNEPSRASDAAEEQAALDVHEGERWYTNFACIECHGANLGGGAAPYTESRSGVDVSWNVPSLNDIFYRYDFDEIATWVVYGRAGTPMPANGLEGGGAMTDQEVDQVMAYIEDNQLSQADALAKADTAVDLALTRIDGGEAAVADAIRIQQAKIEDVKAAPTRLLAVGDLPDQIKDLFGSDGTCTAQSATLVLTTCEQPGEDSDRDGLTDVIEPELTSYASTAYVTLPELLEDGNLAAQAEYDVTFDPANAFTNRLADGTPEPDFTAAETLLAKLEEDVLLARVAAERQDLFLGDLEAGLAFLEQSAELRLWEVDFMAVMTAMNEQAVADWEAAVEAGAEQSSPSLVLEEDVRRAVGLFNSYCARCHTGGYSAGAPYEQGHGSGAWGPSLLDGRSIVQFPNWMDQVDFIIEGSQFGVDYGVNGLGSGRMPGFGTVLTKADIELIVQYERSM